MAFVGIDLGTTTSEIAVFKNGSPQILRDGQGKEIIPSVVGIDNKTREIKVGESALSIALANPECFVQEIKRRMGTQDRTPLGPEMYLPQEISAIILRYLKAAAEDQLGEPVERAVITVPANFPDTARQATKTAGELAGLRVERIINEPTAAALAYGHAEGVEEEIVMIYDLGGGTFDVSIVEYIGDAVDVRASAGDTHLGGKDFDKALLEHVAKRFEEVEDIKVDLDPHKGQYYRLLGACEQAKKELSFNVATAIRIPFFTVKDGQPISLDIEVTRAQFERLIGPMIDGTEKSIDRALKDAGLTRSDIDRVILVGGSTRIPYVRKLVERSIGRSPLSNIDPDRAVALGAAVQAAIIEGESEQIIMDVSTCSLGTATLLNIGGVGMPGSYDEIIPPNTKLLKPFTKKYRTIIDNQQLINFRVYQRDIDSKEEWAEVDDEPNIAGGFHLLGRREIEVPPGPAGQQVRATYTFNLDGNVEVEISFELSDQTFRFKVTSLQSVQEIAESQGRLEKLWQESEYYTEVRATVHAAEKKLDDGLEPSAHAELEALLQALKNALTQDDQDEVGRLERLLTDLLFDLEE